MSRALVVEDSESIQMMLKARLEIAGHAVTAAGDGVEGIETIEKLDEAELPEVILLDAVMPRLDGVGFLRRLNNAGYEIPVIVISAQLELGDAPEWDLAYAAVSKPIDFANLLALMETATTEASQK